MRDIKGEDPERSWIKNMVNVDVEEIHKHKPQIECHLF